MKVFDRSTRTGPSLYHTIIICIYTPKSGGGETRSFTQIGVVPRRRRLAGAGGGGRDEVRENYEDVRSCFTAIYDGGGDDCVRARLYRKSYPQWLKKPFESTHCIYSCLYSVSDEQIIKIIMKLVFE